MKPSTDLERIASTRGSDSYAAGAYKISDDTLRRPIMSLIPDEELTPSAIKWLNDKEHPDVPATPSPVLNMLADGVGAGQLIVFEYPVAEITTDVRCVFYFG